MTTETTTVINTGSMSQRRAFEITFLQVLKEHRNSPVSYMKFMLAGHTSMTLERPSMELLSTDRSEREGMMEFILKNSPGPIEFEICYDSGLDAGKEEVSPEHFDCPPSCDIKPPKLGQIVLYALLPRQTREAVLGCFEEEFFDARKRFGVKTARRMYWWEVVRSLFPVAEAFVIRASKWAGAAALGQIFRHFVK